MAVTKMLCKCHTGQPHTEPVSRRFVHLTEHHHRVFQNSRFFHIDIELVSFPCSFPDPSKDGMALVLDRDIADEFHDDDRLTDSCPSESSDFPSFCKRRAKVDHFDTGFQHLWLC